MPRHRMSLLGDMANVNRKEGIGEFAQRRKSLGAAPMPILTYLAEGADFRPG